MVGTLPEMVQTIVPKDFTQYCSSPPLCTMISYGYTLSLGRIFCLDIYKDMAYRGGGGGGGVVLSLLFEIVTRARMTQIVIQEKKSVIRVGEV